MVLLRRNDTEGRGQKYLIYFQEPGDAAALAVGVAPA